MAYDASGKNSHVQNCSWATKFLIHKFRIRDNDNIVGLQEFGDWLTHKRPQKRAGKPLLVGKTWKTTVDPWRGVAKCSFGLDYMKHYKCNVEESPKSKESRMMGLNGYDSNGIYTLGYKVKSSNLQKTILPTGMMFTLSVCRPTSNMPSPRRRLQAQMSSPRIRALGVSLQPSTSYMIMGIQLLCLITQRPTRSTTLSSPQEVSGRFGGGGFPSTSLKTRGTRTR